MNNPVLHSYSFEEAAYSLKQAMDSFNGSFPDIDRFERSVDQFRISIDKMAAILGMQAENDQRKILGHSMAYLESDFANC